MLPFLHLLFQTVPEPSQNAISAAIGVLSFAVAAGTNYVVSSKAAARLEGANAATFKAIDERLNSHAKELDQVWSKVGTHTQQIGEIRGELNAKGKGHRI